MRKTTPENRRRLCVKLALRDSAHGAGISAGTAVQAGISVDLEVISTLSDSANGAGIGASAAADASIANDISHDKYTSIKMYLHSNTSF